MHEHCCKPVTPPSTSNETPTRERKYKDEEKGERERERERECAPFLTSLTQDDEVIIIE
jgi:hypothetical protein